MKNKPKYIIGIDEVGRGPLAGPVAVSVLALPVNFNKAFFKQVRDSKKLSKKSREEWFKKIKKSQKEKLLSFKVSFVGAKQIDNHGISSAIKKALKKSIDALNLSPKHSLVLLDGGLKAPKEYKNQKTIIKGDELEPVISLASITAKVLRDRKMIILAKKYPNYNFEMHKGYGTKKHRDLIKRHGLSPIHRKSFLTRILKTI